MSKSASSYFDSTLKSIRSYDTDKALTINILHLYALVLIRKIVTKYSFVC